MSALLGFKRTAIIVLDFWVILGTIFITFLFRFDFVLTSDHLNQIVSTVPYTLGAYYVAACLFSVHRGIYYYASFSDLLNIVKAVGFGAVLSVACILFVHQGQFPRSVLILQPILAFLGICAVRFWIRLIKGHLKHRSSHSGETRRVLLIGAGDMGEILLRQMLKSFNPCYSIIGFLDDNSDKWGMHIHGHTVLGGRLILASLLKKHEIDEVIIAIASKRGEIVRSVVETLRTVHPKPDLKIAPNLNEMLQNPGHGFAIRKVNPVDLLNREVVRLDEARIRQAIKNKCLLVTGAGGTIGSELCRQALRYSPSKIILVENHATSLFYREAELREKTRGGVEIIPLLGDIRDQGLLDRVFQVHRPHIVLHAAAHKHVSQLEFNLQEAVSNNVLGTFYVASAADQYQAEIFLLVSTDKAVRPKSIMGATKRTAEIVVEQLFKKSRTRYLTVRFGNVLGSSGSVLRIFQEQIEKGRPITLTDREATRYFMTVEEAGGLILQSVAMAQGGEIFVLKMGTPVRILDMAKNLILLSGLEPDKDIDIRITGLRQGEKREEELVEDPAHAQNSDHPSILLLQASNGFSGDLRKRLLEMELLCRGADTLALLERLQVLIPTFHPVDAHMKQTVCH